MMYQKLYIVRVGKIIQLVNWVLLKYEDLCLEYSIYIKIEQSGIFKFLRWRGKDKRFFLVFWLVSFFKLMGCKFSEKIYFKIEIMCSMIEKDL